MDINSYISEVFKPITTIFNQEHRKEMIALFEETADAHQQVFKETNGEDLEWPIWYAKYMQEKTREIIDLDITVSELVYLLVAADLDYSDETPPNHWADYYTHFFLENIH